MLPSPEIETSATAPEKRDLMLAAEVLYETGLLQWLMGTAQTRGRDTIGFLFQVTGDTNVFVSFDMGLTDGDSISHGGSRQQPDARL